MGRFNFDEENFEKIKTEAEAFYGAIGEVHCPYFGEKISFNAKGLRHLKFKSDQQARPHKDQYPRLKLLPLATEVLKKPHTLQGIWKQRRFETQKINSRWERTLRDVTLYEFIAVLDNVRLRVIVKEVRGGEKHFLSVIPYWDIDRINSKRILYSGDPEQE